jgi:hypothetical protein
MKMNWKMRLVLALVLMAGFVGTATLQHGGFVSTNTTRTDVLMACVGAGNPDGCSGGFYEVFKAMVGTFLSHFQSTTRANVQMACVGAGNPDGCSGGLYEVFKAMWGTIRSHFQSTASSPIRLA